MSDNNKASDSGKNEPGVQIDVGGGSLVSMQTVQHIYNEITGRTEELARSYRINHCVSFDDLRQLHMKICQMYEQYNIVARNCSVTLYHHDDQKQVFSSFERFELFDRTTLSPVENIRIEYNFMIVLPQAKKPQPYVIEINIHSRAAIVQRARLETVVPSGMFLEVITERTAHLEIKYVDYTVARNFQVAIDNWFRGLKQLPDYSWLKPIQRWSDHLPVLLKILSIAVYLYTCVNIFLPPLSNVSVSGGTLYLAGTITFGGVSLLSLAIGRIGSILGGAIRRIKPLSYLNLTRGDENALAGLRSENRHSVRKGLISLGAGIAINLISSWLAAKLGLGQ
jgi:hypothetical protein